jgi:toxin ParE1/3/4
MAWAVIVSEDAESDWDGLYAYISRHDTPARARHVVDRIEQVVQSLSTSPERGIVPPELAATVGREYREVFFKPHRIVYKVLPRAVLVLLVSDGRRDIKTSLQSRLLA